ncbi:hypothetical protein Tco_1316390 [Tanacetum coccineum]
MAKLIWKSIQDGTYTSPMVTAPSTCYFLDSRVLPVHLHILNQTSTAKEIWDNVEMLMQGSGRTLQQRKEDLFDEYERFRAIGNESIHDYFVRFDFPPSLSISSQSLRAPCQKDLKKQEQSTSARGKEGDMLQLQRKKDYVARAVERDVLDAEELEAFFADVECTAPYDSNLRHNYNNHIIKPINEDAYDSDVDEGPNAVVAFMANLSSTSATNNLVNEVHSNDNPIFDNVDYQLSQEMHLVIPFASYSSHPVSIWDSEEALVQQVVSMKKMSEKPGHVRPANGFYEKLNALMFVPQQELSREQAYWLPANERASQTSNPDSPVTPFVHKSRPPSQVLSSLRQVNAAFNQFEDIIKERTTKKPDYVSEWCFDYAKQFVEQQLVPFYDYFKKHIDAANDIFFKEIREFEQIFDELEAEYEQCVLDNKNLTIEKKNLLIKNDCLIAECLEKDICSIVLTSGSVVPPSSNCLCEDLRTACDREHTKVLELEAEVLKQQKMVIESEKCNSHLQKNHIDLQLKFQNYKQCIDTSSASNAIFEINKLRKQLQGKDDTIRN